MECQAVFEKSQQTRQNFRKEGAGRLGIFPLILYNKILINCSFCRKKGKGVTCCLQIKQGFMWKPDPAATEPPVSGEKNMWPAVVRMEEMAGGAVP